jgi:anti-sigma B factor antagonist
MSLYVVEKLMGGVLLLDMRGQLTLGAETATLREHVKQLLEKGYRRIVLDLWEVSYMDSVGISTLVECYAVAQAQGASIKLVRLNRRVTDLMRITRLSTVFEIHETREQVLNSFGGAPA